MNKLEKKGLVTKSEFARYKNCTAMAVGYAIKNGTIPLKHLVIIGKKCWIRDHKKIEWTPKRIDPIHETLCLETNSKEMKLEIKSDQSSFEPLEARKERESSIADAKKINLIEFRDSLVEATLALKTLELTEKFVIQLSTIIEKRILKLSPKEAAKKIKLYFAGVKTDIKEKYSILLAARFKKQVENSLSNREIQMLESLLFEPRQSSDELIYTAKTRRNTYDALEAKLKIELSRGSYLHYKDIESSIVDLAVQIKSRLIESLPILFSEILTHGKNKEKIRASLFEFKNQISELIEEEFLKFSKVNNGGSPNLATSFLKHLKPLEYIKISEWADQNLVLPRAGSGDSRWNNERFPYLKGILDALEPNNGIDQVVVMAGAQIGKTETGNCWLAYTVARAPAPTLIVTPTLSAARNFSKQRLAPLINKTAAISKLMISAEDNIMHKPYYGGDISITGANTSKGLRSKPVQYLFLDEVDVYPDDIDEEGDPIMLAMARTYSFQAFRKIYLCSTPKIAGYSKIEKAFLASNQAYYYVPCPFCGEYQTIKWQKNIRFSPKENPTKAVMVCEKCNEEIEEKYKTEMLAKGVWKATNDDKYRQTNIAGFSISSLYAPLGMIGWLDIAKQWVASQNDTSKLKVFINTVLGETWKDEIEVPQWRKLYQRVSSYSVYQSGVIPTDAITLLTAGIDLQKEQIEVEVVGWAVDKQSWSIDYFIFKGATDDLKSTCWRQLTELLTREWPVVNSERKMKISVAAIDTGFRTWTVRDWARRNSNRVIAIKGVAAVQTPLSRPRSVDFRSDGRYIKRGLTEWNVGTNLLKEELYSWLGLRWRYDEDDKEKATRIYPYGYAHFPLDYPEDYYRQITSERPIRKAVGAQKKIIWTKATWQKNEALDCRIYARAAAFKAGLDRMSLTINAPENKSSPRKSTSKSFI